MAFLPDIIITISNLLRAATRASFSIPLIFANNIKQYTKTILTTTSGLIWTSNSGNAFIDIVYVVSGNNTVLSVARSGTGLTGDHYVITVTVATNGGGTATSTAAQVRTAALLVSDVTDIVDIALLTTGAGVVSAVSATALVFDTDLSKAGVYRTFTSLTAMTDIYDSDDPEYEMASKLLSSTRKPSRFTVYSKTEAEDIEDTLDTLIQSHNEWYFLTYESRDKTDLHACGDWAAANGKRFIGGSDDITALTDRNNSNEMYILDDVNDFSECSILGMMVTYTPGTATWKWKSPNNLSPPTFTTTELQTIRDAQGQTYTEQGGILFLNESKTTNNTYIDDEVFADYLKARIGEDLLTLLIRQPKVAFDPDGLNLVESTVRGTIKGIALVGGIAKIDPTSEDELALSDDGIYKFVVTVPASDEISSGDKAIRTLNEVNATVYLSGAVHEIGVNLIITI